MLVNICEPHIQRFPSIIWTAEERDHNPENKQQINKETRMQFLSKIKINQISRSRHQIKLSTREIALVQHPRYTPCYLDKHHPRYPVKRSSIHVQITVSRKFVIRQSFFTLRLRISHAKASERSGGAERVILAVTRNNVNFSRLPRSLRQWKYITASVTLNY